MYRLFYYRLLRYRLVKHHIFQYSVYSSIVYSNIVHWQYHSLSCYILLYRLVYSFIMDFFD
jgi:hypothetical protein